MSLLKKLFGNFTQPNRRESPSMHDFDFPESVYIFLIGFSYDEPTKETFTWIESILKSSKTQHRILRFHDKDFRKKKLELELSKGFERVEIFCGHGENYGLYGPPYFTNNPHILKDKHSIIYDAEMISVGPSSMFAFCCSAADSFGRTFSTFPGNTFLGFDGDVYFPNEIRYDLKCIFQMITKDIIQKGRILKEHEVMFINEIDNLINSVKDKYRNADLMGSYLLEYKNLFRAYI
jgi:hypothetical protein